MTDTPARGQRDPMPDTTPNSAPGSMIPRARSVSEGPSLRRRTVAVILYLLFGAFINIGIAWACACRSVAMPGTYPPDFGEKRPLRWPRLMPSNWPTVPTVIWRSRSFGLSQVYMEGDGDMPAWHAIADGNDELRRDNPTYYALDLFTAGWPLRCLKWEVCNVVVNPSGSIYDNVTDPLNAWPNGLKVPHRLLSPAVAHESHRRFPLMPLPVGFIVNTALFGAISWVIVALPTNVARSLRLRAGLCPHCRYPIGPSPICTECGTSAPVGKGGQ